VSAWVSEDNRAFGGYSTTGKKSRRLNTHPGCAATNAFLDRYAMLGLVIGRKDYWGKGLGTEAVRLLCRYAFDELNLHRVALSTYAINERGVRLYTRVGFKIEGRKREHAFIEGRYVDEVLMGLLRGEIVDE
jgi:RimJ/RimL family protein N-acetyltransferase